MASLIATTALACGDSDDGDTAVASETPVVAPTSGIVPTSTPLPRRTPTPLPVPTAAPSLNQIVADGKLLFEKDAGGTGCAICHGQDAKGDTIIGAPDNRGASADQIWDALDRVANMAYITLDTDEAKAISAYLQFLATQP
jgi:mono/diheme cytochrome c family protein